MRFQTAYGEKVKPVVECGEGRTKQEFKDECDINFIMKKYQKTGLMDFVNKYAPHYGEIPAVDYHQACNLVIEARAMFDDMPSSLRKKFDNDPQKFLEAIDGGFDPEAKDTPIPEEKAPESALEGVPEDSSGDE